MNINVLTSAKTNNSISTDLNDRNRFHAGGTWREVDFQAASQIHYLYIGISIVNLIGLSDFNHALRMMSNAGAQVRQIWGVLLMG